jgi:hypothetical protein
MSNLGLSSKKNVNLSKGIILSFLTIFSIFYGVFLTNFVDLYQKSNPGSLLPIYITYLPLVCYVSAVFLGLGLIIFIKKSTVQKSREIQSRKKIKIGSIYKEALFLVIFIFAFVPLFGPIFDQGRNDQNFSIYNSNWNGGSKFRDTLESQDYTVMSIQSSLSATERLNKSVLLILFGPNQFYNPVFEIPYFIDFFNNQSKNSILVLHDHGSTSWLLWEIFLAGALDPDIRGTIPVTIFPDGTLRDNYSYYKETDFPVINTFTGHPTTNGIHNVILSQSSAAVGGPFISYFGWDVVGTSSEYSYVDKNNDHVYRYADDYADISMIAAALPGFPTKWPLGIYPQAVFMAKDTGNGRIFVSADASLFDNELIDWPGYDNKQFAINIVNWLTYGEPKENWIIAFDEAHIRPEYSRDLTSAGIYGFFIQYIIHLSTNPITAWIYPVIALYTLRKYLPKKGGKKEKKKAARQEKIEEKEKFRTSSFFAEKINWYQEKAKYGKALILLYRRLERKLNVLLRGEKITTKNVIDMITSKETKVNKLKIKRISKFMDRMIAIKEGKSKVKNEEDFESLFFEMEWVVNNI